MVMLIRFGKAKGMGMEFPWGEPFISFFSEENRS